MKPKTLILMVVAVVCGLGASYMTSRLLAERNDTPAEAAPVEKVTLLVAKKNLEMHLALKAKPEDFFAEKQYVKEDAPKDAFTLADVAKMKGKFLKRSLRRGDHVTGDDLMDNNFRLPLPDGMRAVGIPVSSQQTASGFACVPGSHVDLVWTTKGGKDNDTISKVLLDDVIVLAADINTSNEGGGAAMPANVVTVALHPSDAIKVAVAMETGSIRLFVRNLEDQSSSTKLQISKSELLKDHNARQSKDDIVIAANPVEPKIDTSPKTDTPPVQEPQPPINLTRRTTTVKNGNEIKVIHYWVDDEDRIVAPPAGIGNHPDYDPVPAPSPNAKIDEKKDEKKGGG